MDYADIAARDGLTTEQARVLVEMWAWPMGLARQPAYEQALQGTEAWHAWVAAERETCPTLAEWEAAIKEHTS